jgi:hypothetical protein
MLSRESLETVETIVDAHETEMAKMRTAAGNVREQLGGAMFEVGAAEEAVILANKHLETFKTQVRQYESDVYRAESGIEAAAKDLTVDIIKNKELDPLTKTVFSVAYLGYGLARKETLEDPFKDAAVRGRAAMSSILERLKPGEPILYVLKEKIVADIATSNNIVVTAPRAETTNTKSSYVSIKQGTISVAMPNAYVAEVTEDELIKVTRDSKEAVLLDNQRNIEHLESVAENSSWLIIGKAGIRSRLEQLSPNRQFAAITILKATGVEIDLVIADDVRHKTEKELTELMAFLASGSGQETITRSHRERDNWSGGSYRSQITEDTKLTRMSKNIDMQSIRLMAQTIGLDKQSLHSKVEELLQSRVDSKTTSLNQLAKDIQSMNTLDEVLNIIFK